jgi:hypothetical protein
LRIYFRNWKCTSDGSIYAPFYNPTIKKGKFYIKKDETGASSFSTCVNNQRATRFQSSNPNDDVFTQLLNKYTTASFWVNKK